MKEFNRVSSQNIGIVLINKDNDNPHSKTENINYEVGCAL